MFIMDFAKNHNYWINSVQKKLSVSKKLHNHNLQQVNTVVS